MKMKRYFPILVYRLSSWASDVDNMSMWKEYADSAKKDSSVHVLEVRLAWDACRLVTTAEERCEWIHDCGGNDKTFTTLAIAACKEVGML